MIESAARWPGVRRRARQATGIDVGLDRRGTLDRRDDRGRPGRGATRLWAYREGRTRSAPAAAECSARREPALSPRVRGGAHAARRPAGRPAAGGGRAARPRSGRRVVAAKQVDRCPTSARAPWWSRPGCGTAALTGLPIRPVKGQVLRLRGEPGLLPARRGRARRRPACLPGARAPTARSSSAPPRRSAPTPTVTAGAVLELLRAATDLVPELAECELVETVVRHRPGTPDNAPLLGRLERRRDRRGRTPPQRRAAGPGHRRPDHRPGDDGLAGSAARRRFAPGRFAMKVDRRTVRDADCRRRAALSVAARRHGHRGAAGCRGRGQRRGGAAVRLGRPPVLRDGDRVEVLTAAQGG